jgi:hypothetical protein
MAQSRVTADQSILAMAVIGVLILLIAAAVAYLYSSISVAAAIGSFSLAIVTLLLVLQNERDRRLARKPRLRLVLTDKPGSNLHTALDLDHGSVIGVHNSGPGLATRVRVTVLGLGDPNLWKSTYPPAALQAIRASSMSLIEMRQILTHPLAPGPQDRALVFSDDAKPGGPALGIGDVAGIGLLKISTECKNEVGNSAGPTRVVWLSDANFKHVTTPRVTDWFIIDWDWESD